MGGQSSDPSGAFQHPPELSSAVEQLVRRYYREPYRSPDKPVGGGSQAAQKLGKSPVVVRPVVIGPPHRFGACGTSHECETNCDDIREEANRLRDQLNERTREVKNLRKQLRCQQEDGQQERRLLEEMIRSVQNGTLTELQRTALQYCRNLQTLRGRLREMEEAEKERTEYCNRLESATRTQKLRRLERAAQAAQAERDALRKVLTEYVRRTEDSRDSTERVEGVEGVELEAVREELGLVTSARDTLREERDALKVQLAAARKRAAVSGLLLAAQLRSESSREHGSVQADHAVAGVASQPVSQTGGSRGRRVDIEAEARDIKSDRTVAGVDQQTARERWASRRDIEDLKAQHSQAFHSLQRDLAQTNQELARMRGGKRGTAKNKDGCGLLSQGRSKSPHEHGSGQASLTVAAGEQAQEEGQGCPHIAQPHWASRRDIEDLKTQHSQAYHSLQRDLAQTNRELARMRREKEKPPSKARGLLGPAGGPRSETPPQPRSKTPPRDPHSPAPLKPALPAQARGRLGPAGGPRSKTPPQPPPRGPQSPAPVEAAPPAQAPA